MIPLLTKYGARLAALAVVVIAAVIVVRLDGQDINEGDSQHPSQAAIEQQKRAEEAYGALRINHANYIAETAESDASTKAAALATYAKDKSEEFQGYQVQVEEEKKAEEERKAEEEANKNPTNVDIPGSCEEFSGNRATGCAIMLDQGFPIEEFGCLEALWTRESGWSETAANGSGAYGIPQALPGSKMSSEGSDWESNPVTQIRWGLGYIKGRYGTPCEAWNHSENVGWY
ncbi:aggregation-promoting factor C-terminal-like domain-containing protein [Salininema proteolyticum]|uniref:Lytic transglycosylase domain-containing protein n=1 Tax=Salininema proteolyticum TaxID=1607685 RepID=A0ABV8TYH3_9ACTN